MTYIVGPSEIASKDGKPQVFFELQKTKANFDLYFDLAKFPEESASKSISPSWPWGRNRVIALP